VPGHVDVPLRVGGDGPRAILICAAERLAPEDVARRVELHHVKIVLAQVFGHGLAEIELAGRLADADRVAGRIDGHALRPVP
jgi:hypothetical protein